MKTYRIVILLGLVVYVASFFLTGVKDAAAAPGTKGIPGYECATTTLVAPWGSEGLNLLRDTPVDFFALLFSGWINPLFLITAVVLLMRPRGWPAWTLRIVLLVMFVAPWIIFYKAHLHAQAGYFLWTASMALVLLFPAPRKNAA